MLNTMMAGLQTDTTGAKFRRPLAVDDGGRQAMGVGRGVVSSLVASEAAYAAGDVFGGATFLTLNPELGTTGQELLMVDSISAQDPRAVQANFSLLFFSGSPVADGGMVITDNAGIGWSVAGRNLFLGKVDIQTVDWTVLNLEAVATVNNLGLAVHTISGKIYMVPVITSGAPDWTAGDIVKFAWGVRKI